MIIILYHYHTILFIFHLNWLYSLLLLYYYYYSITILLCVIFVSSGESVYAGDEERSGDKVRELRGRKVGLVSLVTSFKGGFS